MFRRKKDYTCTWEGRVAAWSVEPPKIKGMLPNKARAFFCDIYNALDKREDKIKALTNENFSLEQEVGWVRRKNIDMQDAITSVLVKDAEDGYGIEAESAKLLTNALKSKMPGIVEEVIK